MPSVESSNAKTMTLIVTKGTLDWAYPPFILATTAAAMGVDVTMFFTFYGLPLLLKKLDLEVTPLGNPAMKMPMMGMHMAMPNLVGVLPGVTAGATTMMKKSHQEEGRRLDRGSAPSCARIRCQDDRLPDDDGPLRVQARGHDRGPDPWRRGDLHGECAEIRHQSLHLTLSRRRYVAGAGTSITRLRDRNDG